MTKVRMSFAHRHDCCRGFRQRALSVGRAADAMAGSGSPSRCSISSMSWTILEGGVGLPTWGLARTHLPLLGRSHEQRTEYYVRGAVQRVAALLGCRASPFTTTADQPPGLTRSIARGTARIAQACAPALLNACSSSTATWGSCSNIRINRPARVRCKMPPATVKRLSKVTWRKNAAH